MKGSDPEFVEAVRLVRKFFPESRGFISPELQRRRRIKPANIFLATVNNQSTLVRRESLVFEASGGDHWSRTLVPKITDFGRAKRFDDQTAGQTHTGTMGRPSGSAHGINGGGHPPADWRRRPLAADRGPGPGALRRGRAAGRGPADGAGFKTDEIQRLVAVGESGALE
jgi:hypothetical protein